MNAAPRAPSPTKTTSPFAIGCGALAALVLGALLFAAIFFVVLPRRVLADYRGFVARHAIGTDVDALARDPFVKRSTMILLNGKPLPNSELPAVLTKQDHGELDVMWTHTPPFGRVSYVVTFDHGKIVAARQGSLD